MEFMILINSIFFLIIPRGINYSYYVQTNVSVEGVLFEALT